MKIPCKKLRENAILPTRGTALAAGVDLYALLPDGQESAAVAPQGKYLFPTGIAVEIPEGSKITVTQNGVTCDYEQSGKAAVFTYHKEVPLELFREWA